MDGPFSLLDGHEQVVFGADAETGLRCIIAIYSTALGPALGGTRFFPYASEEEALVDVLRLSKAMAYKAAATGLDLGGGKGVILGDPHTDKSEALLRAYGRVVESLGGRYVTACDIGTYPADMSIVRRETRWATGHELAEGGSGDSGVSTAQGVFAGLRACVERAFGDADLHGRHVAVQGVGKVGGRLAELLHAAGAKLTVTDIDEASLAVCADELGAEVVAPDEIHAVDADVFSPNALGGVLNDETIPEVAARVIAGGANNQLLDEVRHATMLNERGILYAPDFVINAGGLIQVADELHEGGFSPDRISHRVEQIADRLHEIFDYADAEGVQIFEAADRVAERRMARVGRLRGFWLPS
jgi:valine dehydrogenase (NAD+)